MIKAYYIWIPIKLIVTEKDNSSSLIQSCEDVKKHVQFYVKRFSTHKNASITVSISHSVAKHNDMSLMKLIKVCKLIQIIISQKVNQLLQGHFALHRKDRWSKGVQEVKTRKAKSRRELLWF